jgi:hypothetical protein
MVAITALAVLLALRTHAPAATPHPLHTTMTRVTLEGSPAKLRFEIRTFAEDYLAAASGGGRLLKVEAAADSQSLAYVRSRFVVTAGGRSLPLKSCGTRSSAGVIWLCVETDAPRDFGGIQLRNQLLCDRFSDQVNIVQMAIREPSRTTLFIKGDGAKPII